MGNAKSATKTKGSHARNTASTKWVMRCARKSRGTPHVARADHIIDEPQTPPMPGPGGARTKTAHCKTCHAVPFSGGMTIAILAVMGLALTVATLLLVHVNQLQAAQLEEVGAQAALVNDLSQIK